MSEIIMRPNLLAEAADHLPEGKIGIICDVITHDLAAEALFSQCAERSILIPLGKRIRATIDLAEKLRRQTASCDALVAVGSGTINDLTKYVAFRLGIPYVCFATAPSMNGYVSPTASLIFGKHKSSVEAAPPQKLLVDLDIVAQAPLKMIRAGLGDTLCRTIIESDLILANKLTGASYDPSWFEDLKPKEAYIRAYDGELYQRDPEFIKVLMEALIIGGEMMHKVGSSAPCSQSEHMIVHAYDLFFGSVRSDVLHGEAVSVTSITMAHLQQKLLKRRPKFRPIKGSEEMFKRIFGSAISETMRETYLKKALSAEQCEALNDNMPTLWPEIQKLIDEKAMKAIALEALMSRQGCPTQYKQLRWNKDRYEHAVTHAYLTRDRFTFLDIPAMDKTLRAEI